MGTIAGCRWRFALDRARQRGLPQLILSGGELRSRSPESKDLSLFFPLGRGEQPNSEWSFGCAHFVSFAQDGGFVGVRAFALSECTPRAARSGDGDIAGYRGTRRATSASARATHARS